MIRATMMLSGLLHCDMGCDVVWAFCAVIRAMMTLSGLLHCGMGCDVVWDFCAVMMWSRLLRCDPGHDDVVWVVAL